ncbi:proliferating cell nuclear antigen (pcna) [Candidatus Micrarchaeota archaeon]|nr:MAG: proliferating cell nuclear antigen (pcna) [Candidatus Micrarchaeota archaeon]
MFDISFENAKLFKDCVDAIVNLINEGEFEISSEGITLRAMDPSQIAMVDFKMPKKACSSYKVEGDVKIGVNFEDLSRVMGRARPEESLNLKLKDSRLEMTFKGKFTRRFNLPLLDIGGTVPKEPKIEFDANIKLNASVLKDSLKDASLVSSHVVLSIDKNSFVIEATGDRGDVLIETKKEETVVIAHECTNNAKAMFPLEYLNDILKGADSSTVITLYLKTDAPLKVEYPVGQAEIVYYLAPRIENV